MGSNESNVTTENVTTNDFIITLTEKQGRIVIWSAAIQRIPILEREINNNITHTL